MCLTEFNEKVYTDSIRAEGHAEGLAEGRAEGLLKGLSTLIKQIKKGRLSVEEALEDLPISKEEFMELLEKEEI